MVRPLTFHALDCLSNTDGIPALEGAEIPGKAPSQGSIDVDDVIGDFSKSIGGVEQHVSSRSPCKALGSGILPVDHDFHRVSSGSLSAKGPSGLKANLGPVLSLVWRSTARMALFPSTLVFVETAAALFANLSFVHETL